MIKLLLVTVSLVVLYRVFPGNALAVAAYIGAVSLVTFAAFGIDKLAAARGLRRIPEDALLILVCIGGTPGAFSAQAIFRHKTRKPYFNRALIVISLVQVLLIVCYSFAFAKNP